MGGCRPDVCGFWVSWPIQDSHASSRVLGNNKYWLIIESFVSVLVVLLVFSFFEAQDQFSTGRYIAIPVVVVFLFPFFYFLISLFPLSSASYITTVKFVLALQFIPSCYCTYLHSCLA